jgi:hypothetical protein
MERTSCPGCGAPNMGNDRFCQNCGTALKREAPSAAAAPTARPAPLRPRAGPLQLPVGAPADPYGFVPSWSLAPAARPTGVSGDAPVVVRPLLEFDVAYPEWLGRS